MSYDHILLVGFGGATNLEEVGPFLQHVAAGGSVPHERVELMRKHYEAIGGHSPYNDAVNRLVSRLQNSLSEHGVKLPVFLGMRHWKPFLRGVMSDIKTAGLKKGLCFLLASQRSALAQARYKQDIRECKRQVGGAAIEHDYLQGWYDHPLFIEAQAGETRVALRKLPFWRRNQVRLVFASPEVPLDGMGDCPHCDYNGEFRVSSHLVAAALKRKQWSLTFQTLAGGGIQEGMGPDILTLLEQLAGENQKAVVCIPVGFLFDSVEVLYDLDLSARKRARELGLRYERASTVMENPIFVRMLTGLILTKLKQG